MIAFPNCRGKIPVHSSFPAGTALLVLFLILILSRPVNAADNACLRVLTYNISGLFTPVPDNVVLDAMQALDADLIGFQEVYDVRGLASLFRNDARGTLEASLRGAGYRTYWSSYAGASAGAKPFIDPLLIYEPGNLIAVREGIFEEIEAPSETALSYFPRAWGLGRENRVLQHVRLRWRELDMLIDFYNTHLTHRGRRSDVDNTPLMNEVRKVRHIFSQRAGEKTTIVFTADINLVPANRGYRLLKEGDGAEPALIDTWGAAHPDASERPATLHPDNSFFSKYSWLQKLTGRTGGPPPLHLDYVFLGPKGGTPLRVRSSKVVLDQRYEGDNYSDHYGVLSDVCGSGED